MRRENLKKISICESFYKFSKKLLPILYIGAGSFVQSWFINFPASCIHRSIFCSKFFNFFFILNTYIKRPNCALDRRRFLCLYVPGFLRQTFRHVLKCKWIPLTKLPWILRTITCNVNFFGTFVLPWIPQQAIIASCSGFRNCKWIPHNVIRIRKSKWNPQNLQAKSANVSGFRKL